MPFKPMDQNLIRELLVSEKDIITPALEIEDRIYSSSQCPVCRSVGADKVTMAPKIVSTRDGPQVIGAPFSASGPLIVGHAKCKSCGTEYSPSTGVIIKQNEPIITDPNFTDE